MLSPTMTSAGAVAKPGTARNRGERKRDRRNIRAVTTLVRPVRPPAAMPAALSAKVVVVEVPSTAPTEVPTASESSAPRMRGRRPFSSSMCPWEAMPIMPPRVSNTSTKRKESTTVRKLRVNNPVKSICIKVGARLGTARPAEKSGRTLAMPSSALGT